MAFKQLHTSPCEARSSAAAPSREWRGGVCAGDALVVLGVSQATLELGGEQYLGVPLGR